MRTSVNPEESALKTSLKGFPDSDAYGILGNRGERGAHQKPPPVSQGRLKPQVKGKPILHHKAAWFTLGASQLISLPQASHL